MPRMHRMTRRFTHVLPALVPFLSLVACGESATAPRFQPEVANTVNNFAFQVTALRNVSDIAQYSWRNDGTSANVNQSPSNLSGTVSLVVLDATGTQVYSRSLTDNGTFVTSAGTAGLWTVRVTFSNVSGAVNFRLQKP